MDITFVQVIGSRNEINESHKGLIDQIHEFDSRTWCHAQSSISNLIICAFDKDKLVGYLVGGIYPQDLDRDGQWNFGENRYRSCWIDYIEIDKEYQSQRIGTRMVVQAEQYITHNLDLIPKVSKTHIYLVSVETSINFWYKLGWQVILTQDHPDDEDFPSVYANEIGNWMAKPITSSCDSHPYILPHNTRRQIPEETLFFDKYDDSIVESYSQLLLFGAENLSLDDYQCSAQNCSNNIFDSLLRFSINYKLSNLKRVYNKLLLCTRDIETELTQADFEDRFLQDNPEAEQIREWVKQTFP